MKAGGTPLGQGRYRLYLDDTTTRYGPLTAGDTDDYDRLFGYLKVLGYYQKTAKAHVLLGREFTRVMDMRAFLRRQDISYMCRFLIFRELLSASAMDHLRQNHYGYSPFNTLGEYVGTTEPGPEPAAGEVDPPGEDEGDPEEPENVDWILESIET